MSRISAGFEWWALTGSNRRPSRCKRGKAIQNAGIASIAGRTERESMANEAKSADHLRTTSEYRVDMVEDKPTSGMWHCGPNAAWVTVTHLPTRISARAFDQSHHHAKQAAQACCEMMVEQSRLLKCQFPERLAGEG